MAEIEKDEGKGVLPTIDSMLGQYVAGAMVKGVKEALQIDSLDEIDDETYEMIFGGMPIRANYEDEEEEEGDDDYADEEDEDDEEGSEL